MNKYPLLSIIVPIYNIAAYLEKCIESIQNQSYCNIEIILVNDGSTDDSGRICDEYAKGDRRICVIHKENEGLVKARKTGVRVAKGEYVSFVDGDDWIDLDMYECLMQHADETIDMITSRLIFEWETGKREILCDGLKEGCYHRKELEEILPHIIYSEREGKQLITTSVCNKIFKSKYMKNAIEFIDEEITYGEDGALLCSFLFKAQNIVVTSLAKYHYVQHRESMIKKYNFDSFSKIYKLQQCITSNSDRDIPNIDMSKQIEYYVSSFLENAQKMIYGLQNMPIHFLFPYECVNLGENIILYGAGIVGQSYYKCIQAGDYVKIVAWVDKNWNNTRDLFMHIQNPACIRNMKYDHIVIAIENNDIAQEVIKELVQYQVKTEKIIWKKPIYIR